MVIKDLFRFYRSSLVSLRQSGLFQGFLFLIIILFVFSLLAVGCTHSIVNTPQTITVTQSITVTQPSPHLLVEKEASNDYLAARLVNCTLDVDNKGYIRTGDYLIIWPFAYSLQIKDNAIFILDGKGQEFALVGDTINLDGGFTSITGVDEKLGYSLPSDIAGPYWLAAPDYSP